MTSDLWRIEDVLGDVELVRADIRRLEASAVGPRVDCVYHMAAAGVTAAPDTVDLIETNVVGTKRALDLAVAAGASRFVYCGSCFEYGPGELHVEDELPQPLDDYAASKAAGWLLARATSLRTGLPVASVRPFTVFGPYEAARRLVPATICAALNGAPVRITAGTQARDFVCVRDATAGIVAAGTSDAAPGGTFNLCTGVSTTVFDLAERVCRLCGTGSEVERGAIEARERELPSISGDPRHANVALGWRARTALEDGLLETIEWFRAGGRHLPAYASTTVLVT
jgi:nucleoside-diphosphate-sugar epimerase